MKVHEATGIPWIPDFRDPWTNIDFYQDLRLTRWADRKHHQLEHKVLTRATRVVTASWRSRDEFKEISGRDDIVVIPNGYDDADFANEERITPDEKFTVVHLGSMNKDRNPDGWWKAVRKAVDTNSALKQNLQIKLVGPVDFIIRESVNQFGLQDFVEFKEYIPHAEAVKMMRQAQVLLLIINHAPNARTMIPGKLYEYLGSGRPLFTIGYKDSDSAKVIHMTNGGPVLKYDDVEGMKEQLLSYFEVYQSGKLDSSVTGIERFTRKNLAGEYALLLDSIS
jgi:glycosyltransferase involved in cell wall biosynthesis